LIAGAGTGKTMTLAHRVARLVERGAAPERILLLTFSRRAATEMLSRAAALTQAGGARRVCGGTFHAVAAQLLRGHGRAVGVPPGFMILDQSDAGDLMNLVRGARVEPHGAKRFPRKATLIDIYSRTVNAGVPLRQVLERWFPWCADDREAIAGLFTAYAAGKRDTHVLDYDDLLLFCNALLASPAAARVCERFDHVLVDEYQDVNAMQAQILVALHREIHDIFVVGDDAQAIYSFRSATVEHIRAFPRVFAEARVVVLHENYRATAPLLAASNAVIALAPSRYEKDLVATRTGGAKPELITCRDE
jgi:DNA helicase-2/ATP-dependent DNA helicase PcrA